jgi:hypothetical protein
MGDLIIVRGCIKLDHIRNKNVMIELKIHLLTYGAEPFLRS